MAAAAKDDLDSRGCKDNLCPPGLESDVASYNTLRAVSPAGFIAGALLLGAGALTVGLAPSSPKSARIQPLLGPGQAGVKLVF
ncbi:MAG: hypothetical protein R3F14_27990 [Polyangiaceae bacterium]